jgi:hypothetical protein
MEVEAQPAYQPLVPTAIQWTPSKDTTEKMERIDSPHARVHEGLGRFQRQNGKQSLTPHKPAQGRLQQEREKEQQDRENAREKRTRESMDVQRDDRDAQTQGLKRKERPGRTKKRSALYCLPIV